MYVRSRVTVGSVGNVHVVVRGSARVVKQVSVHRGMLYQRLQIN